MRRQRGRKVPLRRFDTRGADSSITGSYVQYDTYFDMTITLFGEQHTRRYEGQLPDYERLISYLPESITTLRRVARDIGEQAEEERFAQLLRDLPSLSREQQTLKVMELTTTLDVLAERISHRR